MPELISSHPAHPDATTAGPGEWIALHIFYAASPRPMLVDCVRPLVDRLTGEGLLAGHFFINYWLEGPHVRLRLRPRPLPPRPRSDAEPRRRSPRSSAPAPPCTRSTRVS